MSTLESAVAKPSAGAEIRTVDLAFCHALTRCGAVDEGGEEKSGWMRMTAGYRRVGGRWWIVHEHFSAPFDMQTLKILDLAP